MYPLPPLYKLRQSPKLIRPYAYCSLGGGKLACAHGGSLMSLSQPPPPSC